jgi:glycosyltransferase involved in cell wall biosynthesis
MRIALFHNTPSGGAKRAIYEWTRRLSEKHQIDVYTLSSANHDFCDIRPYVHTHNVFKFTPRKLFNSPWGRLDQFQRWRDLGDLECIGRRIADQINSINYDIVFGNTCLFTFIPAFIQYLDVPIVYYLHEPFGQKYSRKFQRPYLKSSIKHQILNSFDPFIKLYNHRINVIQSKNVFSVNRLLANSDFTKTQMERSYGLDSAVCFYGVNSEGFHPILGAIKGENIISVGEISPRKGFDFIIESLAIIPQEFRPRLVLASNRINSQIERFEETYLMELAVNKEVELQILTNLSVDELNVQYNQARFCVYAPILEPFGLVPLEAMSCGTPVIGVREGGVQESIIHEKTGLLVDRNPTEFADAIMHLLSNQSLAEEYGRNGREHVLKNWTWERSVSSLENHLVEYARMK